MGSAGRSRARVYENEGARGIRHDDPPIPDARLGGFVLRSAPSTAPEPQGESDDGLRLERDEGLDGRPFDPTAPRRRSGAISASAAVPTDATGSGAGNGTIPSDECSVVTKADVEAAFGGSSSAGKIDENGHCVFDAWYGLRAVHAKIAAGELVVGGFWVANFDRSTIQKDTITLAKTILPRL